MDLKQQVKNYTMTIRNTRPPTMIKEQDKSEFSHFRALQVLANGDEVPYEATLRNVIHDGARQPKLPPRQTQKHPGYIRNESGGFFTS
ncbi:hypothetical protein CHLRE_04g216203v5 [Chlamydomonas reinhardtii]|uniref:Uncharacterized protein n=2 Tax=Chlamydomonas reinhardtii TaxID=3055 RepID=A0A2K3DTN6_CHLRE|nr:uncharacterized protein CHLRE_04g216250v5 [Chlamydomonas reinhardtii]XP_042925086.1 uncharacterized protein CHLRE_04g216203v5 [Chlamydomonas reinhardtii]6U42_6Q Chain 6Q, FAP276 [Chlamydomonas reinhardtii]6U42_6R Chain 6R, FAP276 [Chlamydomonas reinhardtii]6U42_6S Chain 6S, FAP276 [Chlamydomonas reinhardtii]8GLV_6Q Chain 6Q, FAP339 [Chlamydomonas reinhardtii]8GLV_6R Chain 6R, FAP339 [Chlamydomonas reinhardtii]8GLV_6S Chain 6S, FAP339 [Chlamydomonas reinhardtii]8GLV_HY Chain HY, FAP339 [C